MMPISDQIAFTTPLPRCLPSIDRRGSEWSTCAGGSRSASCVRRRCRVTASGQIVSGSEASSHSAARPEEKCFLVVVELQRSPSAFSIDDSLQELGRLAETAGMVVVGQATQKLDAPIASTYIGSGKVKEVRASMAALGAKTCVFDDELSPAQQRTLERAFGGEQAGIKVLDRTAIILDIFAQHARTREGQLQVELALYQYRLPRLTRMWTHLERQSGFGGVGLRGPGETQLEVDRRMIGQKISLLRQQLDGVRGHRQRQRNSRKKMSMPLISLVGYTNAGKSSLLNALTTSSVSAEDKLFATLDPTTRRVNLPGLQVNPDVLMTDTVGFIQKLPTQLVAAFRATLEEVVEADVIVHVVDYSSTTRDAQIRTVDDIMESLGAGQKPTLLVWNKIDLVERSADEILREAALRRSTVAISARSGDGLDDLVAELGEILTHLLTYVEVVIPYDRGDVMNDLYTQGTVEYEQYLADGTYVSVWVPASLAKRLVAYRVDFDESDEGAVNEAEMWKTLAKKRHDPTNPKTHV